MVAMGFLQPVAKGTQQPPRKGQFLNFDSGQGITCAEGCHNNIVLGSTGSGKTSSVILPASAALLAEGFAGLVIDIKGNFSGQLRSLAKQCGRESDIVEFGSFTSAMRGNILEGLSQEEVYEFLRILAVSQWGEDSRNMEWCLKGVRLAADCWELLGYLREKYPQLPTGITALEKMLNDYSFAARLFKQFMAKVHTKSDRRHKRFAARITSEEFHVLAYDAKKKGTSFAEQATWRLQGIRAGIAQFLEAPGVAANFAATDGTGINLEKLVYDERKVVLLRFNVEAGAVGGWLARYVAERFYKAVYARGLRLAPDEYTFFIADEFQDFINLSPRNRLNDNAFTAKAREFRVIQIIGTQSISALASRGASLGAVLEYVNNFNNRIVMYCDDPATQVMTERHDPDTALNKLGPGECLAIRFNLDTRRHEHSRERLQKAHDDIQAELRRVETACAVTDMTLALRGEVAGQQPAPPEYEGEEMEDILDGLEAELQATTQEEVKQTEHSKRREKLWENGKDENANARRWDKTQTTVQSPQKADLHKLPEALRTLAEEYPQFFQTVMERGDAGYLAIPQGWIPYLGKAMEALRESGLPMDIYGFTYDSGQLAISQGTHRRTPGVAFCNALLTVTREICPLCGGRMTENEVQGIVRGHPGFCKSCLNKYGLGVSYDFKEEEEYPDTADNGM